MSTNFFEKFNRRAILSLLVILCLISSLILLAGCGRKDISGKNFRFPLEQEPVQIDPNSNVNESATAVIMSLFEGLTRVNEEGTAVPALASWTVSEDNLKYTFTLVESFWSDYKTKDEDKNEIPGTKVTAGDFAFGIKRSLSKNNPISFASQLFDIKNAREVYEGTLSDSELGVSALSDTQLVIELAESNSNFLMLLSTPPFMPCNEKFFNETSGRYGMDEEFLLTNGAFKLRAWNANESLLLNKHLGYYAEKEILPNAVRYVIGEPSDPITALKNEDIDAAQISKTAEAAAKEENLILHEQNDLVRTILFNCENTYLSNSQVRRSLRAAIEWDLVSELIKTSGFSPASGFSAPQTILGNGELYRTSKNSLVVKTDAEQAKADWAKYLEKNNLKEISGMKLVTADDEESVALARVIAQSWQKNLSFYCELVTVSQKDIQNKINGNFDIVIYEVAASSYYAQDAFAAYTTDSTRNLTRFSDSKYDKKCNEILGGKNDRASVEATERLLWELSPAITLSNESRIIALSENCVGVIVRPFGGGIYGATFDFRKAGKSK